MKKFLLLFPFALVFPFFMCADDFTDILQDLAIQTACLGQYSATQAGGGWYDDPHDYYTPQMMASRFKNMSGSMTRTTTFYGVCFDYAECAYWDIKTYQNFYNQKGMYEGQFWIAGVDGDSSLITLSNPTTRENATRIQNGVYVKTYGSSSYKNIRTHKTANGIRATYHAWLWIMRDDGVWFWIDPTWTDNLGYVVYGYVSGYEEIQCRPDEKFCKIYPAYLKNLPSPPARGTRKWPSENFAETSNSGYSSSYSSSFSSSYSVYLCLGTVERINFSEDFSIEISGFEMSLESTADKDEYFAIFLFNHLQEDNLAGLLFGFDVGYSVLSFFQPYCGGFVGIKGENGWEKTGLTWKVNGGIRIPVSIFCLRADISYSPISKVAETLAFGVKLF